MRCKQISIFDFCCSHHSASIRTRRHDDDGAGRSDGLGVPVRMRPSHVVCSRAVPDRQPPHETNGGCRLLVLFPMYPMPVVALERLVVCPIR